LLLKKDKHKIYPVDPTISMVVQPSLIIFKFYCIFISSNKIGEDPK